MEGELALLKACSKDKDLYRGSGVHACIVAKGLLERKKKKEEEEDRYLGNALVSLYAKCGALSSAQYVFDRLVVRDVVSWNALISGYGEHDRSGESALRCFHRMHSHGIAPNAVTYVCVLKACASQHRKSSSNNNNNNNNSMMGKKKITFEGGGDAAEMEMMRGAIVQQIVEDGLLRSNVVVGNSLVDMYAKCGALARARAVLEQLPGRNAVTWNALISGYIRSGEGEEALKCFEQMQAEGMSPDEVTYICSLQACGSIGDLGKGREIHGRAAREGLSGTNILVGATLVDMYAKCGALAEAREAFDELRGRNVVTWSALIAGYALHGHGEEALGCAAQMQREALFPNAVTFVSILKACGQLRAADKGKEVHAEILRRGGGGLLLEKNLLLANALLDMYAKCSLPLRARDVFDRLPVRSIVSWTSLIAGYAHTGGHGREALGCFQRMQNEGLSPNAITFVAGLKACGAAAAGRRGKEMHSALARNGLLSENPLVGNALVAAYAKCGLVAIAEQVFDRLPAHDAFSWNALIHGYAQRGDEDLVVASVAEMSSAGIRPDQVTFTLLLNACSHAGLLEEGKMWFERMSSGFGMLPTSEHRACMIDLFRRAGHLGEAAAIAAMMPSLDDAPLVWTALLAACQRRGDVELGEAAFKHAMQLNEKHAAAYVCMRNTYSARKT